MATWDTRKFLIVVKTYPNPSASLQEVVCTAAVDEDGNLVRLFPIPFRTLSEAQRFKKWQWIRAKVTKASDPRRESFRVDATTIEPLEEMPAGPKGWPKRWERVKHLLAPSLEDVSSSGASLGLIRPQDYSMTFEDQEQAEWTPDERDKLLGNRAATDLFGNLASPRSLLQKVPVKIRYQYKCEGHECEHHQLFEDWEVGESWRRWKKEGRYPTRPMLEEAIRHRYADVPREKDNLFFFIGTHSRYPDTWMVIGHAQPLHLAKNKDK